MCSVWCPPKWVIWWPLKKLGLNRKKQLPLKCLWPGMPQYLRVQRQFASQQYGKRRDLPHFLPPWWYKTCQPWRRFASVQKLCLDWNPKLCPGQVTGQRFWKMTGMVPRGLIHGMVCFRACFDFEASLQETMCVYQCITLNILKFSPWLLPLKQWQNAPTFPLFFASLSKRPLREHCTPVSEMP